MCHEAACQTYCSKQLRCHRTASTARHTSNQEPNTNKIKREESRRILVCQESSFKCAEGVRIEEAGQQVAKS